MLKSKLHRATVTLANTEYEGSLSIDPALMELADICDGEQVHVVNINNGERFVTYAIPGGPGEIGLNGAAARLGVPGDKVIIMTYVELDEVEVKNHVPRVIRLNEKNQPLEG